LGLIKSPNEETAPHLGISYVANLPEISTTTAQNVPRLIIFLSNTYLVDKCLSYSWACYWHVICFYKNAKKEKTNIPITKEVNT